MMGSLEKKPENGGIPKMANQAIPKQIQEIFITPRRAPKRRISTCSFMACITEPAPRNN